jgi:hypothetical protein
MSNTRPLPPEQRMPHRTPRPITSNHIVRFKPPVLLLLSCLNIYPRRPLILPSIHNPMIEPHIHQIPILLSNMPIHDPNNLIQRQNRHAIRMVFNHTQIHPRNALVITHPPPANIREALDTDLADVIEQASTPEDAGRGDAVLGGAQAGVEGGPGFEDEGGDGVLGEEEGEEEPGGAGADNEDFAEGSGGVLGHVVWMSMALRAARECEVRMGAVNLVMAMWEGSP